jgi:hydrogenase nickel incorporation protein HypA/HybF
MHELSIARSIVEIVEQYVSPNDCRAVREVKVKVGGMAGVVPDSLEFCFSAITADTFLQNAKLRIEQIPFTIKCETCGDVAASAMGFVVCPRCGSADTTVVGGTELQVTEIELAEPAEIV